MSSIPGSQSPSEQRHHAAPQENILTAIAVNERAGRTGSDARKQGIALSWLFHLIGDIRPPVHAVTLFSREYPNGDRGGIEMCVRASLNGAPIELHRLWDGVIRSSGNISRLKNIASPAAAVFWLNV